MENGETIFIILFFAFVIYKVIKNSGSGSGISDEPDEWNDPGTEPEKVKSNFYRNSDGRIVRLLSVVKPDGDDVSGNWIYVCEGRSIFESEKIKTMTFPESEWTGFTAIFESEYKSLIQIVQPKRPQLTQATQAMPQQPMPQSGMPQPRQYDPDEYRKPYPMNMNNYPNQWGRYER